MSFKAKLRAFFAPAPMPKPRRSLPARELAPVADIIEQGLLVADVAIRMTVKNRLIVRALKHQEHYSQEAAQEQVRRAISELVAEREADAENIEIMRTQIHRLGFASGGEAEYGRDDTGTLKHRQEVYEGVAAELKLRAADPEYIKNVALKATELAWAEVGASIAERASHPYYSGGDSAEYQAQRAARIQDLINKDLRQLQRSLDPEITAQETGEKIGWLAKFLNKSS